MVFWPCEHLYVIHVAVQELYLVLMFLLAGLKDAVLGISNFYLFEITHELK